MFTESERAYLASQHLARLATVSPEGTPDVAVVGFSLEDDHFFVGGFRMMKTLKYRNVLNGNQYVALVVDDLPSDALPGEGKARGIKIHGTAEIVERGDATFLVITPDHLWSWGIESAGGHGGTMRRAHRGS